MPPSSYTRIYAVVRRIPPGKVATYGQVAALAGLPGAARQVGYALYALPQDSAVPWHRVINAQGRISIPDAAAAVTQRLRLEREGVRVAVGGKIRLADFLWEPEPSRRRR